MTTVAMQRQTIILLGLLASLCTFSFTPGNLTIPWVTDAKERITQLTTPIFEEELVSFDSIAPQTPRVVFCDSEIFAAPGDTVDVCLRTNVPYSSNTFVTLQVVGSNTPHLANLPTSVPILFLAGQTQLTVPIPLTNDQVNANYVLEIKESSHKTTLRVRLNNSLGECGVLTNGPTSDLTPFSDRFGNAYSANQLVFAPPVASFGGENCGCGNINTGVFRLDFEDCTFNTNMGFDHPATGEQSRQVLCEAFAYLNGIINGNTSDCYDGNVNIRVQPSVAVPDYYRDGETTPDLSDLAPAVLGAATAVYPTQPAVSGIRHGIPWTIINTGALPPSATPDIAHGILRINGNIDWYLTYTTPIDQATGTENQHDLFTVCLHEAMHILGFSSGLDANGGAVGSTGGEGVYEAYDMFLELDGSTPRRSLIENVGPVDGFPNSIPWRFNNAINPNNELHSSCNGGPNMVFDAGANTPFVYTGTQLEEGSSFSHLSGDCQGGGTIPYVMNPFLPVQVQRLTLEAAEIEILDRIGYDTGADCAVGAVSSGNFPESCNTAVFTFGICPGSPATFTLNEQDIIGDDPNADGIVAVEPLGIFNGTVTLAPNGDDLIFTTQTLTRATFLYQVIGCNGKLSNVAQFEVNFTLVNDPNCAAVCDLDFECGENSEGLDLPNCDLIGDCSQGENACNNIFCNPGFCGFVAYERLSTLPLFTDDHDGPEGTLNGITTATDDGISLQIVSTPGWITTSGTPDYIITGPVFDDGAVHMGADNFTREGIMTFVSTSQSINYFLGFDSGFADPVGQNLSPLRSIIDVDLVDGEDFDLGNGLPIGATQSLLAIDETSDAINRQKRGTFFTPHSTDFSALWIRNANDILSFTFLDDFELIADDFTAGFDLNSGTCGQEQFLPATTFCMLSDIEVRYDWFVVDANGDIITPSVGSYTMRDGMITGMSANFTPLGFPVAPSVTTTYRLIRTIIDSEEVPVDFNFCREDANGVETCFDEDEMTIFVTATFPDAGFTVTPTGCGVYDLNSTNALPGDSHEWLVDDIPTGEAGPTVTGLTLTDGVHTITHRVGNDCGTAEETITVTVTGCGNCEYMFSTTADLCGNVTFNIVGLQTGDTFVIDYGDNSVGMSRTYTYATAGIYTATLAVNSPTCGIQIETVTFSVVIGTPDAAFSITETTCGVYDFTGVDALPGDLHTWTVDGVVLDETGPTVTGLMLMDGVHTIVHAVENVCGTDEVTQTITTANCINCDGYMMGVTVDECGNAVATISGLQTGDNVSIDFDDGTPPSATNTHTYTEPGIYTVVANITNSTCDTTLSETIFVNILPAPSALFISQDDCEIGTITFTAIEMEGTHRWFVDGVQQATTGPVLVIPHPGILTNFEIRHELDGPCSTGVSSLEVVVEACPIPLVCPDCSTNGGLLINPTQRAVTNLVNLTSDPNSGFPQGSLDLTGRCLTINGTLVIDQAYTITGGEIFMQPGSKIMVSSGDLFTLENVNENQGIHGCTQMWEGIIVEKGSSLVMRNCVVQDAHRAVSLFDLVPQLEIQRCTFQNNYIGLTNVEGGRVDDLDLFIGNTFEFTDTEEWLPAYPGMGTAIGDRGYTGILFNNFINLDIGEPTFFFSSRPANTFRGMSNGIITTDSRLEVTNTTFEDLVEDNTQPHPRTGFGIHHTGGPAHSLNVTPQFIGNVIEFTDCHQAIMAIGTEVTVAGTDINNASTGIEVQAAQGQAISMVFNNIEATNQGIVLSNNDPSFSIDITLNTINIGLAPQGPGFTFPGTGIRILETGLPAVGDKLIANNFINTVNGDVAVDINGATDYTFTNNTINLAGQSFAAAGFNITGGGDCTFFDNTVSGPGVTVNDGVGISMRNSGNNRVLCNNLSNLGTGIFAFGECGLTDIIGNTLAAPMGIGLHYGPTLSIKPQLHAGNIWDQTSGTFGVGAQNDMPQTVASGVSVQDRLTAQNLVVNTTSGGLRPPSFNFPNLTGNTTFLADIWFPIGSGSPENCANITPDSGGDPGGFIAFAQSIINGSGITGDFANDRLYTALWQQYTYWSEAYISDPVIQQFVDTQFGQKLGELYYTDQGRAEALFPFTTTTNQLYQAKSEALAIEAELQRLDSLAAAGQQVGGQQAQQRQALAYQLGLLRILAGEWAIQRDQLANWIEQDISLTANHVIESNLEEVQRIYLRTLAKGITVFTTNDEQTLLQIAQACPLSDGPAVYMARSLYHLINPTTTFNDNCIALSALQVEAPSVEEQETPSPMLTALKVWPNPSRDVLNITWTSEEISSIEIRDQLGRVQYTQEIAEGGKLTISTANWLSGMFILSAFDQNGQMIASEKIIRLP